MPETGTPSDDLEQLFQLVYDELRLVARGQMRAERQGLTLQPTALVHEAYLRLLKGDRSGLARNRSYFFAAASRAMRRILIERARRVARQRHGGELRRVTMVTMSLGSEALASPEDVLTVDRLLRELEEQDEGMARLIELRFFGGLTVDEAATVMEVTPRTLHRKWRAARAWLQLKLEVASQMPAAQEQA